MPFFLDALSSQEPTQSFRFPRTLHLDVLILCVLLLLLYSFVNLLPILVNQTLQVLQRLRCEPILTESPSSSHCIVINTCCQCLSIKVYILQLTQLTESNKKLLCKLKRQPGKLRKLRFGKLHIANMCVYAFKQIHVGG